MASKVFRDDASMYGMRAELIEFVAVFFADDGIIGSKDYSWL